jgi:hypothetical protein
MPIAAARRLAAPGRAPIWVLVLSGLLGFWFGFVAYPTWQVAVEPAQVVAGLVSYPAGNPNYIYQSKLWTILHQVNALLLLAGFSEITLSRIISGVLGMVSIQALAMVVFAFSRDVLLAVGAAGFILFTKAASNGGSYPIDIVGTHHTYGALGLSTIALAAGLIGSGSYRLGGFLLGLAPAVHPSLGSYLLLIVGLCAIWNVRAVLAEFRPGLIYFLAGCAVTAASLTFHLAFTVDVPTIAADVTRPYLLAFMSFWDGHRAPVSLNAGGVTLNRYALAIGIVWLVAFRRQLPRPSWFLLRIVAASAALSLLFVVCSWIPLDRMPLTLLILMPTRLVNLNAMLFPALLLGLMAAYRGSLRGRLLLLATIVAISLTGRSALWSWVAPAGWAIGRHPVNPLVTFELGAVGLLLVAASIWRDARTRPGEAPDLQIRSPGPLHWLSLAVCLGATVLMLQVKGSTNFYLDRHNDPFFAAIAADKEGLLLTAGSYDSVQLYTRRPVLLSGSLDMLPYAPELGPEMQRILLDVYGADLFHPPDAARGRGVLPRDVHRGRWEGYSRERWAEIGRTYNVTQVLVPIDWSLDLPLVLEDRWRLYDIPSL